MRTKAAALFLILALLLTMGLPVLAVPETESEDISSTLYTEGTGYDSFDFLFDGNLLRSRSSKGNASLTLTGDTPIGYLYLIFQKDYPEISLENPDTGENALISQVFLHHCIDLSNYFDVLPKSVILHFEQGSVSLNELTVFSPGRLPQQVQQWQPPAQGKTDLLLLSTHGDDEQLFFAGLLPLYAGEKGVAVQVAYLTDHRNLTGERVHEMLNGLWSVGCNVYPVFGSFPDFRIDSLDGTYQEFKRLGYSADALTGFVVEQLRRFRPQVVVGHDIQGEYGHGMHMVYTDCLIRALEISMDASAYPELAEKYGVWDVPKTYLHLYEENAVTIDYDRPLDHFNGMTAFEVTQKLGFPCHKSQQYTWFTRWLNGKNQQITKASEIATYSPCSFGLFRSTMGEDVLRNDFMENIVTYAQQEQLEQERLEAERLEQERLEQEKLEAERLEQERQEAERLEAEEREKERLEQERLDQEKREQEHLKQQSAKRLSYAVAALIALIAVTVVLLITIRRRKKNHR